MSLTPLERLAIEYARKVSETPLSFTPAFGQRLTAAFREPRDRRRSRRPPSQVNLWARDHPGARMPADRADAGAAVDGGMTTVPQPTPLVPTTPHPKLDELIAVAEKLRAPGGCAWDREQTHESLVQYLVEESYELIDAIETTTIAPRCSRSSATCSTRSSSTRTSRPRPGHFTLEDVAAHMTAKMVGRHPTCSERRQRRRRHPRRGRGRQLGGQIKRTEKSDRSSVLDGIPQGMQALALADKVLGRAAKVGGRARGRPSSRAPRWNWATSRSPSWLRRGRRGSTAEPGAAGGACGCFTRRCTRVKRARAARAGRRHHSGADRGIPGVACTDTVPLATRHRRAAAALALSAASVVLAGAGSLSAVAISGHLATSTGTVLTALSSFSPGPTTFPTGVAADRDPILYVSDPGSNTIFVYSYATGPATPLTLPAMFSPLDLVLSHRMGSSST